MNKNKFENIAIGYLEDQEQLIDNHDPYDEIKWSYYTLRAIGEVA